MVMAPAGWAIERAMAAVPLSRIADRRAIAPEHLSGDVGSSQPPALLPPRAGLTRITAAIIRRFIVHLPVKGKRSLRDNESGGTATPLNTYPTHSPINASLVTSRPHAHD